MQPSESWSPASSLYCSAVCPPHVLHQEGLVRLCQLKYLSTLQVIFRYALAIFKYNEEEILRIHDSVEIYQYLRFFTRMIMDGR